MRKTATFFVAGFGVVEEARVGHLLPWTSKSGTSG